MRLSIKKNNMINIYCYISLIVILYLSGSIYNVVYDEYRRYVFGFAIFILSIGIVVTFPYIISDYAKELLGCIVVASLFLLAGLINGSTLTIMLGLCSRILSIFIFVTFCVIKKIDILEILFHLIFYIAIVYLVFYLVFDYELVKIEPRWVIVFPDTDVQSIYRSYLDIYYRSQGKLDLFGFVLIRSNGPFWEAGMYQIFLNWSLVYAWFVRENSDLPQYKTNIIIIAIVFTTSTAGIINLLILFFLRYIYNKKSAYLLPFVIVIGSGIIYALYDLMSSKLETRSYYDRTGALYEALSLFIEKPLFGHGASIFVIAGLLGYIIKFGLIGFFPIIYFIRIVLINKILYHKEKIAILLWWGVSLMTQPIESSYFFIFIYMCFAICYKYSDIRAEEAYERKK